MVTILIYVLLGILIYIAVIPIVEELATVIVQGLEVIRGKMVLVLADLQDKADRKKEAASTKTNVIGFSVPEIEDYEEDYNEDES